MVKKSTLLKKLSSYSALASVAIAAAQKADAQIVYHAITPPKTLVIDSFMYLDLNNDGINDFGIGLPPQFKSSQSTLSQVYAFLSARSVNYVDMKDTVDSFLKMNNYKSVIGAADHWGEEGIFDYWTFKKKKNGGNFAGQGDKYAGLKLTNGGKTYYGWVRVNLNTKCDTLIVKDYAYDTIPGESITAGEGEQTGITPLKNDATVLQLISPNPATVFSNIIYSIRGNSLVTLELYDITGRKIETLLNNAQQTPGRNRIPADVSGLSSGVYFYKLTVNGQAYTQKLVVTH